MSKYCEAKVIYDVFFDIYYPNQTSKGHPEDIQRMSVCPLHLLGHLQDISNKVLLG